MTHRTTRHASPFSLRLAIGLVAAAALLAIATPADAHRRGGGVSVQIGGYYPGPYTRGYGYWGPRRGWGGVGIGIGAPGYYYYGSPWVYQPGYVVVQPPPVVYADPPLDPAPPKGPPDPIFYPRNGQSVEQIEADRQDCNRWAMTQPGAIARADVFHRATLACMEGRGYTVK